MYKVNDEYGMQSKHHEKKNPSSGTDIILNGQTDFPSIRPSLK